MRRAIELAVNGLGHVAPNPLVGCVIEHKDRIVAEGWHRQFGGPHAEVNAILSAENAALLKDATLYVTLEPCAHYGKTPPCSSFIVKHEIPRVVIATVDPFSEVSGRGIAELRKAGIDVRVGILREEAIHMNRRFLTNQLRKRPYIILKWAQSADGYMDMERKGEIGSFRISGDDARRLTHRWRGEESAILVGANTIVNDNPLLTCRYWEGKNPTRIVLDPNRKLKGTEKVFNSDAPTMWYTEESGSHNDAFYLPDMLERLLFKGITSVLVEGGKHTLEQFIGMNLWDEIRIFTSNTTLGNGLNAPKIMTKATQFIQLENDTLGIYFNPNNSLSALFPN
ncbi:MAG: bifunctional diaminohydroxyphosphoribosylaminopyrimidine deaminase/5-amino-6-(5-phosphoribosylamino)uracil reductase RibD [Bacteroidia bacterium]|jgi:diaminohydroxyphosphoribosylaminopyrimidine deaminase/5-amino-6-(5-phosphoribosylamino)uracil reductase